MQVKYVFRDEELYKVVDETYCVEVFGEEFGALFSKFYSSYRNYKNYSFENMTYMMEKFNHVFINVYKWYP